MKRVLLAGGAGYIGSHIIYELLSDKRYKPFVVDNFCNSTDRNIKSLEKHFSTKIDLVTRDVSKNIDDLVVEDVEAVIHLAAWKAVGESVDQPLMYYQNNLNTTLNLLDWCKQNDVKKFIFSSTASVYGQVEEMPITEETIPNLNSSPYAKSKFFAENIIRDLSKSDDLSSVIFRYFNVAGNQVDGVIGDECKKIDNLVPRMMDVYLGKVPGPFGVFGNDYPTPDGTGVRDYIHVVDLAKAHVKALNYLNDKSGSFTFNLGTGNGTSVLEMIKALEKASSKKFDYTFLPRRAGDPAVSFTNPALAKNELDWEAKYGIEEIMKSVLKWYKN